MLIYGKNPIEAALDASSIIELYALSRFADSKIVTKAKAKGIKVHFLDEHSLSTLAKSSAHQGYVAKIVEPRLYTLQEIIKSAKTSQYPLILLLDEIEDPHNLGAIIRSADVFGVDGIVIKKRREAPLNATVAKVSAGAFSFMKIAEVANLTQAIVTLKKDGYWLVASDGKASKSYAQIDYKCPIALVIGSEGFGISRLILKNCDFIVKIPMTGHVSCLNASVASAVIVSQIVLSRNS